MDIKTYQKATAILRDIDTEENKLKDLRFLHDDVKGGENIFVTSALRGKHVSVEGRLAIRIIELLQQEYDKKIKSLKTQLEEL